MRIYRLIVAVLIATFTASVTSTPAYAGPRTGPSDPSVGYPAQATFQLLCRGGGSMNLVRGGPVPDANGVEMVVIELTFTRSTKAAGAQGKGLKPGQCSWIDRPVNDREPVALRFKTPLHAPPNPGVGGKADTQAERFPDAFSIPEYMKSKNHYYSFSAYTENSDRLRATESKFFKPTSGK
ncbi:MAG: hypothetical protein ABIP75_16605 [Pyrinomonadaceae bacterium]